MTGWYWHEEWYEPTLEEDERLIREFINKQMDEAVFTIKNPKGLLNVAKQVKLVVGEGDDKIEIGVADVEKLPNGDAMATLNITNPSIVKALGGAEIKGIILSHIEEDTSE